MNFKKGRNTIKQLTLRKLIKTVHFLQDKTILRNDQAISTPVSNMTSLVTLPRAKKRLVRSLENVKSKIRPVMNWVSCRGCPPTNGCSHTLLPPLCGCKYWKTVLSDANKVQLPSYRLAYRTASRASRQPQELSPYGVQAGYLNKRCKDIVKDFSEIAAPRT